jgi:hypothetical protein
LVESILVLPRGAIMETFVGLDVSLTWPLLLTALSR